jgi:hypothetical protein
MVDKKEIKTITKAQRYSKNEFALIEKAAKKQHLDIGTFIRKCSLDTAREINK